MYEIILDILNKYKSEVDNFNDAVFECDFENVIDEICDAIDEHF